MADAAGGGGARAGRKRQFNLVGAKRAIVFWVGLLTGAGSGVTGIGAQAAFAPMLTWMLGFRDDKAQATATRYAAFVAASASVVALWLSPGWAREQEAASPDVSGLLGRGLLLMVCATVGAAASGSLAVRAQGANARRLSLILAMVLMLFVVAQTAQLTTFSASPRLAVWSDPLRLGMLGVGVGVLSRATGVLAPLLLIPALYYLGGFTPHAAIALSLLVTALSSALPALSYSRQGTADATYGPAAAWGGLLGGALGGWLLSSSPGRAALILFALVGMFLCGRELSRIAGAGSPSPS